jgi:hypothetical protein
MNRILLRSLLAGALALLASDASGASPNAPE